MGGLQPPLEALLSFPVWPIKAQYFPPRILITLRYSERYPNHSETFPMSEYSLSIYRSLPLDHFEIPRHVRDLIRDSKHPSVIKSHKLIIQIVIKRLACGSYGFKNYVDMTETPLRSITNSGTWMPILVPTYSTKIFIGQTFMTTYVIPFVCRYVTCPRFDRRYLHT